MANILKDPNYKSGKLYLAPTVRSNVKYIILISKYESTFKKIIIIGQDEKV